MRFLCDEMLGRLARLLRAAGYDTYLAAKAEPDDELIRLARREGRILVTRDKRLAAAAEESVLVDGFGTRFSGTFTRLISDSRPISRPPRSSTRPPSGGA
jgi:hypothetical protein